MSFLTGGLLDWITRAFEISAGSGDRTTDSGEAIRNRVDTLIGAPAADVSDDIAAVKTVVDGLGGGGLSDKEKSLLGVGVFPGFQDFFNTIANNADPDPVHWSVTAGGGTVDAEMSTADEPGFISCITGSVLGNHAIVHTSDKLHFSFKTGVTTIHLKAKVKFDVFTENGDICGIGFVETDSVVDGIDVLTAASGEVASIVFNDQVPKAFASDGSTAENADLSSWITDNTWFICEIIISASDVKYYIDETLRATLNTNVPLSVWQIAFGATVGTNSIQKTFVEWIQIWGE